MNELKLDYSKKGKNPPQIKRLLLLAGIIMIALSLATLIMVISQGLKPLLLYAALANTIVGIGFILQAAEHKILFQKKYIHISSECIAFKLGGWYKEHQIEWNNITGISDQRNSLIIHCDDQVTRINMLHFPSSDEKRIRSTIHDMAKGKGI